MTEVAKDQEDQVLDTNEQGYAFFHLFSCFLRPESRQE